MGSDCEVSPFESPYIDGYWLVPARFVAPEKKDECSDSAYIESRIALAQLKALGATEEHIKALMNYKPE